MNEQESTVMRCLARAEERALPIRAAASMSPDPECTVGIATIKVMTEDMLQAIAYGSIDREPEVIARLQPMSRDASDLEPLANWLNRIVSEACGRNRPLRIWMPHRDTLDCLDVLGHRYATNTEATASLQRMGELCRIIASEAVFESQQVVAVALDVLLEHIITGQSPIEDHHLDALLAWIDPPAGTDPVSISRARSRFAASGVLVNTPDRPDDDDIERYRGVLKNGSGAEQQDAETRIRAILESSVMREWQLMVDARHAYLNLDLSRPRYSGLVESSNGRVRYAVNNFFFSPKNVVPLTRRLVELEGSQTDRKIADTHVDEIVRASETRRGRVVHGRIVTVIQERLRRKPCTIVMKVEQSLVRLRLDDHVQTIGGRITGVIREIARDPHDGHRLLTVEIMKGVLQTGALQVGVLSEWMRNDSYPMYLKRKPIGVAEERGGWIIQGDEPPQPKNGVPIDGDPLELARKARRK